MSPVKFQNEIKVFIERRLLQKESAFELPLSDELHNSFNFFDLYPMDGGGGLFSRSIIPTFNDGEYADYILKKGILKEFGGLPHLDHYRFERWRSIEKNCWLNRFYFIVPLAKRYAATRDETLARLIIDTMLHFIDTCPPPGNKEEVLSLQRYVYHIRDHDYNRHTPEENMADETDVKYIWFDFQPASRLLHWLHVIHFLRCSPSIRAKEWALIISNLYRHAEVIYYGERFGLELIPGDNHQSLRGLVLLLAGAFFKGFGLWRKFIKEGVRLINFHAENTFAADGSEIENSPSYHIFTTWHIRDALLLSRKHDFALNPDIEKRLRAAMDFVKAVTTPDGLTVALNDGYAVNGAAFLKSLSFIDSSSAPARTYYFPNAGLAVYNTAPYYLLLDASPHTGHYSHYHGGKNAVTLWIKGRPFLIDSGCAPYDDPSFNHWYKHPQAHSSLLVKNRGDGLISGLYDWQQFATLSCSGWKENGRKNHEICAELTSSVEEWKDVRWQRCLEIKTPDILVIRDRVQLPSPAELTFIFNLHPDVALKVDGARYFLQHPEGVMLEFIPSCKPGFTATTKAGKCYINFAHRANQQLLLGVKAGGCFQSEIVIRETKGASGRM